MGLQDNYAVAPDKGERIVVYDTGRQVEGKCVELRLLYSGDQLFANGDAAQKHAIRRVFHPQLKQLWNTNPSLRKMAALRGACHLPTGTDLNGKEDEARGAFFNWMGSRYPRGSFQFVPLVEQELCLRVSLDILFLRRDQHPLIQGGGDIDNRLKTLFDAFRVPSPTIEGLGNPSIGEEPLFVLLQDDKLISDVSVTTGNILLLPQNAPANSRDVFLVIHVRLKTSERGPYSVAFE
jgi:hypothetical protein